MPVETKKRMGRPPGIPTSEATKEEFRRLYRAGRKVREVLSPLGVWEDDIKRADALEKLPEVLNGKVQ
jgi:hypothetical protein